LRAGVTIQLTHGAQQIPVEPYTPPDLTDVIEIGGSIDTKKHGPLRWTGRAGLSVSLPDRFNAVHVAFGHRVIEVMRDPFKGKCVPTIYVEIVLDSATQWKFQLSEHKDKVVEHRETLVDGINAAIKALLEKSQQQSQNLALRAMTAPIEAALNKAMRGAGILHMEEAEESGFPVGPPNPEPPEPGERVGPLTEEGNPAKPAAKPTGVSIEWLESSKMEGRAYGWHLSGKQIIIQLDRDLFHPVMDWPPKFREPHVVHILVSLIAHAVEMEWQGNPDSLRGVMARRLVDKLDDWANEPKKIAPYLYAQLIPGAL